MATQKYKQYSALLAFAIWQVWSVAVVNLPNIGFKYTPNRLFWLNNDETKQMWLQNAGFGWVPFIILSTFTHCVWPSIIGITPAAMHPTNADVYAARLPGGFFIVNEVEPIPHWPALS